jgi:hypothetical protein
LCPVPFYAMVKIRMPSFDQKLSIILFKHMI